MIRRATSTDLEAIVEIHNQAIREGAVAHTRELAVDQRADWFATFSHTRPLYVAELDGRVAGWVSVTDYRCGREALLQTAEVSYFVGTGFRRQGIARQLVDHVIGQAPRYGVRVLLAILLGTNQASIELLVDRGFEHWGTMKGAARIGGADIDHVYYGINLGSRSAPS